MGTVYACVMLAGLPVRQTGYVSSAPHYLKPPGCYNNSAFGPAVGGYGNWTNGSYELSWEMCQRSWLGSFGVNIAGIQQALSCRHNGTGLRVVVLGGSVSCGVCKPRPLPRPDSTCPVGERNNSPCLEDAYPRLLERALNLIYPCPTMHRVTNLCQFGVGIPPPHACPSLPP